MICMVENGTKSDRCRFCNSSFSEDILNKITDNRDDVYCENCGDIIKQIQDKYNFNPAEITENESKADVSDSPGKPQKELKPHPDVLNYPIGRVFYDTDFPLTFKSNLILVFSRLTCFHALYLEREGQIQLGESEIPENALNDLYMSTRHVQDMRIQPEFLNNLHDISKDEFERNLKQLQGKIQSNRHYLEDFHVYSRWLIREVYLLISDGLKKENLSKFDRIIRDDLISVDIITKEFLNRKERETETYSSLELINDLRQEIRQFSEELAQIFPNRLYTDTRNQFSHIALSKYWGEQSLFIQRTFLYHAKNDPNGRSKDEYLSGLDSKLEERLGAKALGCVRIIRRYENYEINAFQFVDLLEKELGRVSGEIKLNNEEMSLILGCPNTFIRDILSRIKNLNHKYYKPNYKFPREHLSNFKDTLLTIFGSKAKKCLETIQMYEDLNPDLNDYPRQQYNVKNPELFHHIGESIEASYWFGLLSADGSLSKISSDRRITLELSKKDADVVKRFAKAVGLPLERVKYRPRIRRYKGEIKKFDMVYIKFGCKPMTNQLEELGFSSSKAERKYIPDYVEQAYREAKTISKQTNLDWWLTDPGKVALAFLLGFFDGDGSYQGGRIARIFSSNKGFLEQVKEFFEIKNEVLTVVPSGELAWAFDRQHVSKGFYSLGLGPRLYDMMMNSYEDSMQRKRHDDKGKPLNFLGNLT